ncbi:unnamed protein product [Paramecium sonneborni]|uniref:protein-tyrosine-phosphatase n=1 Tax=Paramecium sonneborni TaxID=65129 RepID=A0A8S1KW73_9CILI|nr:unnamed protein product [Paramecium sonneborni]
MFENNSVKYVPSVPKIVDPEPITCIIEPSEDEGGLYLGNLEAANNIDLLRKMKIRAVLTASQETAIKYQEHVVHFHEIIMAHDKADYDIIQHFEQAYEFIDRHRKYTNVFVHCFAGISRSASMVIAYLMKKYNLSFEKALWNVKAKRRQVQPNVGFIRQLQKYENVLKNQAISTAPSRIQYQQQQFPQYGFIQQQIQQPIQQSIMTPFIQQSVQQPWNQSQRYDELVQYY